MTVELTTPRIKYSRRTIFIAGAALATATYFAMAWHFTITYREEVPRRDDIAVIHQLVQTATPGTLAALVWLPNHVASATVYENGVLSGDANAIYDHPDRTWSGDGKRWKYVEFNTMSADARIRRWIIFR
jgi:hypothetical protein